MTIPFSDWMKFSSQLAKINSKAAAEISDYMQKRGGIYNVEREQLIDYAYGVVTKYGEASSSLAAEMYDALAELSGKNVPPAMPAPTPSYDEVAKTINGTIRTENEEVIAAATGRLVKRTGANTTLNNALRDGAEFAWVPVGDTCAFCITLASRGWQRMSKRAMKNGHAEHIHANCDCTYAVRFDSKTQIAGYDPDVYRDMYYAAEGSTPSERINSMRRTFYSANKAAGLGALSSSVAEEINVIAGRVLPTFSPASSISGAEEFAKQFTIGGRYSKVDYSGLDLQYANEMNRAMNEVLSQYDPKYKLKNIEPMNMRSKEFKGSTAEAAYRWGSNDLFYNKNYFKTEKDFKRHLAQASELKDQIMPNLDMLIDRYSHQTGFGADTQLRYVKALKQTGRTNVSNMDVYGTTVHELGHYLDDTIFRSGFKDAGFDVGESFRKFSGNISAYATENNREYVAESFLAYWNGETENLDPKLVDIFERARK